MKQIFIVILIISSVFLLFTNINAQQKNSSKEDKADSTRQSRLNTFNELISITSNDLKSCLDNLKTNVENTKTEIAEGKYRIPGQINARIVDVIQSSLPCLKLIDDDNELYKETIVLIKLSERVMEDAKIVERKEPAKLVKSIAEVDENIVAIRQGFNEVLNNIVLAESYIFSDLLLKDIETSANYLEPVLVSIKELNQSVDKLGAISIKVR